MFSFIISIILGYILIPILRKKKLDQVLNRFLEEKHKKKHGTPTMGGVIFIVPSLIIVLLLLLFNKIEINYIFVVEKYRRKNIANQLLNYIIDNYEFDNITLEVNVNNISAINLYKKNKFNIIGIRPNYYNGVDAYLMERR